MTKITRRGFLKLIPPSAVAVLASTFLPKEILAFTYLEPIDPKTNPLVSYPNRDWEKVYRDIFTPDYSFHYLCAPNDTHGCLLNASVKNGILRWVDPSFNYKEATDLYGNLASARWDPRICPSGLTYARRFYSDRRVKGAFVRKGFKAWVEDGFPRDSETGLPPKRYHEGRGKEDWLSATWDEAYSLVAKGLVNIVETYSGKEGTERLRKQDYDPAMVDKTDGAGTRTVKVRGGMPLLGPMRIGGIARFGNMLALLDARTRGVSPAQAKGGKVWDSYTWHTDLPPGHPMVSGNQTCDFDLYTVEHARVITLWGKNWISTKMVDAHWLTEAKLHGAKVITIATEYQSTSHKADDVIIIRPGMDTALALGLAHIIIKENLFDVSYVKSFTDLPLLVRMDNLKKLNAKDLSSDYKSAELKNYVKVFDSDDPVPPPAQQGTQFLPSSIREEWGDFTVWDSKIGAPRVITRDNVGNFHKDLGIDPALEGEFKITLADGNNVTVRPVFDLIKQHLLENFEPESASEMTWVPKEAIISLAHEIAANKGSVIFMSGMGPNQFLNGDLKDRAIFLVASLTNNVGNFGGQVGSYAGNYRLALFPGIGQYFLEDPFNQELNPTKPSRIKRYLGSESAHYYNYGDRPLRVGNKLFTGTTHIPTPTKVTWWANTNSILGNAKWAHDVMMNTLPKIEMMVVNEWFWTATCEYSDVIFGVDSWAERKLPDIYAAVTNPFLQAA
ncbi:MAG: molybdopterin-dependent oxidoreductase, partial [Candidatus Bathyarchaeia archaeon]